MQNHGYSREVAARIRRVEQHLTTISDMSKWEDYTAQLAKKMESDGVPGVSVAVIHQDQIEWVQGYGVRDAETREPVTPDTLFQAASISKPVTAAAVLRLVEAGRLDLDADVASYLTSWHVPKTGDWQPRITLRQLLCHGAGVTVQGFPGYTRDTTLPTLGQVLTGQKPANTEPVRVDTLPDLQFRYSGGGYCILQQILMDVTGQPFPELMRELVLEPVGMARSTFIQPLPHALAGSATSGHHGNTPVVGKWHTYPEMAAAGLWTTPSDLARFALAIQRAWAGRFPTFLSQGIVHDMLTPQIEASTGLGFHLSGKREAALFSHTGGNEGFLCILEAYVYGDFGAVVMTNSNQGWQTIEAFKGAFAQEYGWPDYPPPMQWPAPNDPALLNIYVGVYELKPGFTLHVTCQDSELFVQLTGQEALMLSPDPAMTYRLQGIEVGIRFVKGEEGEITSLIVKQNGKEMVAPKIKL